MADFYELLGVSRDADADTLKRAYRQQARKYHPDVNKDAGAEDRFKEIGKAYEVLSDSQKRARYDQFGEAGLGGAAGMPDMGDMGGFADLFETFFNGFGGAGSPGGSRPQRRGPQQGDDLRYDLTIDFDKAIFGQEKEIKVPHLETCDICRGTGAKQGTGPVTCATCGGAGQVRMQQGFFSVAQTCGRCSGSGQIISNPCKSCRGQGRVEKRKTLSVKIPAGVDTGDRIRLSGEGEAGINGGPSGDLFVQIKVLPHDVFERDGKHLYCEAPISFIDAALGGDIQIPTLDGKVKIKIPEGTQTGKLFRLRGKGISPIRGGSTGDLLCRAVIETPQNLSRDQKELLREFQVSISNNSKQNPLREEWFSKVKSFFDTKN